MSTTQKQLAAHVDWWKRETRYPLTAIFEVVSLRRQCPVSEVREAWILSREGK